METMSIQQAALVQLLRDHAALARDVTLAEFIAYWPLACRAQRVEPVLCSGQDLRYVWCCALGLGLWRLGSGSWDLAGLYY